jgi:hypothetical protein
VYALIIPGPEALGMENFFGRLITELLYLLDVDSIEHFKKRSSLMRASCLSATARPM